MNMDWKLVSAFATGAVLASGIVYFAVKPDPVVRQDVPKQVAAPLPETRARTPDRCRAASFQRSRPRPL